MEDDLNTDSTFEHMASPVHSPRMMSLPSSARSNELLEGQEKNERLLVYLFKTLQQQENILKDQLNKKQCKETRMVKSKWATEEQSVGN